MTKEIPKDLQFYKFCAYGFLKNLRFFEPFLILFYLEKGLTFTEIGSLYAIRELTRNIFEIPSGVLADIFGRRRTMVFSFSSYIISYFIFYFSNSFYFFIPAVMVYGFGDAFRTGTHKAMIFEYLKIKKIEHMKAHYYGHTRSWSQKGSALSSVLGAALVFYNRNYSVIFLVSAIPHFLDLIMMLTYPKELDGGYKSIKNITIKDSFNDAFKSLKTSFIKKDSILCVSNVSIFSGFHMAIKDYIQPVIRTLALTFPLLYGFNAKQQTAVFIGILYFIIYNLNSIASGKAGKLSDIKGKSALNITLGLGFIAGILSGIFYGFNLIILSVLFFIGVYVTENIRKPIGISYISEKFDDKILASVLSVASQAETIFAAITAFALGILADIFGVKWGILCISGIYLLISPLVFIKAKKNPS